MYTYIHLLDGHMLCVHTCQTLVGAPQDVIGWWERREDQQQRGLFLFVCVVKDRAEQASWEPTNGLDELVRRC